MTISDLILADHRAGREMFAVAGNSPYQSTEERAEEFARFRELWTAHNAMMEEIVYPAVETVGERASMAEAGRRRQQQVAGMIADLAERAAADTGHDLWLADFQRLKTAWEALCQFEEVEVLMVLLRELPPDQLRDVSLRARDRRLDAPVQVHANPAAH